MSLTKDQLEAIDEFEAKMEALKKDGGELEILNKSLDDEF